MRAFWSDPYLWVHLAGLAAVPVFLEVCLVGLAMGDPLLPAWVEILLVAIAGIAPILWMQWQRPFSIYSLVAVAVTPSQLTDDQRRILKIFKSQESRVLAAIAAVVLFLVLVKIYALAPIATTVAPHVFGGRLAGLLVAAIAFLLVNLFVQVPVSVLRALAVSQTAFAETIPYPSEQVGRSFSLLGIGVKQILPPMEMEPRRVKAAPMPPPVQPAEALRDDLWDEAEVSTLPEEAEEAASAAIVEVVDELEPILDEADLAEVESAQSAGAIAEVESPPVAPIDEVQPDYAIAELTPPPEQSEQAESAGAEEPEIEGEGLEPVENAAPLADEISQELAEEAGDALLGEADALEAALTGVDEAAPVPTEAPTDAPVEPMAAPTEREPEETLPEPPSALTVDDPMAPPSEGETPEDQPHVEADQPTSEAELTLDPNRDLDDDRGAQPPADDEHHD